MARVSWRHLAIRSARAHRARLVACAVLSAGLLTSCAGRRQTHRSSAALSAPPSAVSATVPPSFLMGPARALLASDSDFTARIVVTKSSGASFAGNVFQREGSLLFVPMSDEAHPEGAGMSRFRFLWDAPQQQCLVMSEAVRGYLVVSQPEKYAVPAAPSLGVTEPIEGQPCVRFDVTVEATLGPPMRFRVWRPVDTTGPPVRIETAPGVELGMTIQLSEVNDDPLSPELFSPAAHLTRYPSAEKMVEEVNRKPNVLPYTHDEPGYGRRGRR